MTGRLTLLRSYPRTFLRICHAGTGSSGRKNGNCFLELLLTNTLLPMNSLFFFTGSRDCDCTILSPKFYANSFYSWVVCFLSKSEMGVKVPLYFISFTASIAIGCILMAENTLDWAFAKASLCCVYSTELMFEEFQTNKTVKMLKATRSWSSIDAFERPEFAVGGFSWPLRYINLA